ncbi:hypothetical protein Zmor_006236 [Zophobas morio]|uniref:Uncharacterized protein n=1 Tax=Zophobas morio TaxID=2755281 RepID=A0AA38IX59_9CUCU|nr:hypothetical protein Zmor_006236 [Zophobas morio]
MGRRENGARRPRSSYYPRSSIKECRDTKGKAREVPTLITSPLTTNIKGRHARCPTDNSVRHKQTLAPPQTGGYPRTRIVHTKTGSTGLCNGKGESTRPHRPQILPRVAS